MHLFLKNHFAGNWWMLYKMLVVFSVYSGCQIWLAFWIRAYLKQKMCFKNRIQIQIAVTNMLFILSTWRPKGKLGSVAEGSAILIWGPAGGGGSHVAVLLAAYCRLYHHGRNLAEGGCLLSRFHFTRCRYFLGHVACRNLPWQGLWFTFVLHSRYCSLSFPSFVSCQLVIEPVQKTKKLPMSLPRDILIKVSGPNKRVCSLVKKKHIMVQTLSPHTF